MTFTSHLKKINKYIFTIVEKKILSGVNYGTEAPGDGDRQGHLTKLYFSETRDMNA